MVNKGVLHGQARCLTWIGPLPDLKGRCIMIKRSAHVLSTSSSILGEGPLRHEEEQSLYWVDIIGRCLHIYSPAAESEKVIGFGRQLCAIAPRRQGLIAAFDHEVVLLDNEFSEEKMLYQLADPDDKVRFNDGKCDPAGRFWVGSMANTPDRTAAGSLYCVTPRDVEERLARITVSNGLSWSKTRDKMYYIDTPTGCVDCFDYDLASGSISNRQTLLRISADEGSPDGMTIDEQGRLWIALWGGWSVICFDPLQGSVVETIELPAARVTSCTFGGADRTTLYITTARTGLTADEQKQQPLAGRVFCLEDAGKGLPADVFAF